MLGPVRVQDCKAVWHSTATAQAGRRSTYAPTLAHVDRSCSHRAHSGSPALRLAVPLHEAVALPCRKVDLKPGEVLTSVLVPWAREHELVAAFKQAHRKEDDIALVNAGMRMHCVARGSAHVVDSVSLVYGGVGPKVVVAEKAQAALRGKRLSKELLQVRRCGSTVMMLQCAPQLLGQLGMPWLPPQRVPAVRSSCRARAQCNELAQTIHLANTQKAPLPRALFT